MKKAKVFSTLTAITVGAVASVGFVATPTLARADQHETAGDKHGSDKEKDKDHHTCKDGKDKDGHACSEHSCSGKKGESSCGGKK